MGRSIPSITYRVDSRLAEWGRFAEMLPPREQRSFQRLVSAVRDRRTAIDEADEDLDTAMLLAMILSLRSELDARPGGGAHDQRGLHQAEEPQGGP